MALISTIRVLIVDDHRLFNDGLCLMLNDFDQIEIVGQIYHSPDTLWAVQKFRPDVLILDVNMPQMNGLDVAKDVLKNFPQQNILIVSMYTEEKLIKQFRQMGVKGYLLKTASAVEVFKVIEAIQGGQISFNLVSEKNSIETPPSGDYFLKTFQLTGREVDVLRLIRKGFSSAEIANQLSISIQTIETHRKNMCTKLKLKGQNELLKFAIKHEIGFNK